MTNGDLSARQRLPFLVFSFLYWLTHTLMNVSNYSLMSCYYSSVFRLFPEAVFEIHWPSSQWSPTVPPCRDFRYGILYVCLDAHTFLVTQYNTSFPTQPNPIRRRDNNRIYNYMYNIFRSLYLWGHMKTTYLTCHVRQQNDFSLNSYFMKTDALLQAKFVLIQCYTTFSVSRFIVDESTRFWLRMSPTGVFHKTACHGSRKWKLLWNTKGAVSSIKYRCATG